MPHQSRRSLLKTSACSLGSSLIGESALLDPLSAQISERDLASSKPNVIFRRSARYAERRFILLLRDEDIRLLAMAIAVRHKGAGRLVNYEIGIRGDQLKSKVSSSRDHRLRWLRKFGQRDEWRVVPLTAINMAETRSNDDATSAPESYSSVQSEGGPSRTKRG